MTNEELKVILEKHHLWTTSKSGGEKANLQHANLRNLDLSYVDLTGADLRYSDLSYANLRNADLQGADLEGASLQHANLEETDLSCANLKFADLNCANLIYADLECAELSNADLSNADLNHADLRGADLRDAVLNGTKGLPLSIDYMAANFERTDEGYIAYKIFGKQYRPPDTWKIEAGSVISENVNFNRCNGCGSGINVAPLAWVKRNYNGEIWKVLIRWKWLCGVVVPYHTNGKIRCERVELLGVVE